MGESCGAPGDCATGHCADGVCCDTDCTDACRACNLPDNRGTCVAVARGKDPAHGSCATQAASSCGTNGLCDGMGACQFHEATTVCGDAACDPASNSLTPERRCDGNGTCVAATGGALSCAPFMCNAARTGCADRCTDGDVAACVLPNVCIGRIVRQDRQRPPVPRRQPVPVGVLRRRRLLQRPLLRAVHGVRRRRRRRHVQPGAGRQPARIAPGVRRRGHVCGGQCTAASATACTYPAAETSCRSASCTNGATSAVPDDGGQLRRARRAAAPA